MKFLLILKKASLNAMTVVVTIIKMILFNLNTEYALRSSFQQTVIVMIVDQLTLEMAQIPNLLKNN